MEEGYENIDLKLVCRTCLASEAEFYKLDAPSGIDEDNKASFMESLQYCIQLDDAPNFPMHICATCSKLLKLAHRFIRSARETNDVLKRRLLRETPDVRIKTEITEPVHTTSKISCTSRKTPFDRPKRCKVCGEKLHTKRALKEHVKLHMDMFIYKCQKCSLELESKAELQIHYIELHGTQPSPEMLIPQKKSSKTEVPTEGDEVLHPGDINNSGSLTKTENDFVTEDINRNINLDNSISCVIFNPSDAAVLSNMNFEDMIIEECEDTGDENAIEPKATTTATLSSGSNDHATEYFFDTEIKPMPSAVNVEDLLPITPPGVIKIPKKSSCKICPAVFTSQESEALEAHMLVHKDPRFFCCKCSFSTLSGKDMSQHYKIEHNPRDKQPINKRKKAPAGRPIFICDFCIFETNEKDQLRLHYQLAHEVKATEVQLRPTIDKDDFADSKPKKKVQKRSQQRDTSQDGLPDAGVCIKCHEHVHTRENMRKHYIYHKREEQKRSLLKPIAQRQSTQKVQTETETQTQTQTQPQPTPQVAQTILQTPPRQLTSTTGLTTPPTTIHLQSPSHSETEQTETQTQAQTQPQPTPQVAQTILQTPPRQLTSTTGLTTPPTTIHLQSPSHSNTAQYPLSLGPPSPLLQSDNPSNEMMVTVGDAFSGITTVDNIATCITSATGNSTPIAMLPNDLGTVVESSDSLDSTATDVSMTNATNATSLDVTTVDNIATCITSATGNSTPIAMLPNDLGTVVESSDSLDSTATDVSMTNATNATSLDVTTVDNIATCITSATGNSTPIAMLPNDLGTVVEYSDSLDSTATDVFMTNATKATNYLGTVVEYSDSLDSTVPDVFMINATNATSLDVNTMFNSVTASNKADPPMSNMDALIAFTLSQDKDFDLKGDGYALFEDFDIDKDEDQQRDDFDIDKDEDQQRDAFDIDKDEDQQRDDFDIDKDEDQQRDAFDIDKDEDQQRDDFDIDKGEDQQRDAFDIDKDEDQQRDDFDIDKDEDQQRDDFDIDKDEDQQRDDFDIDKDEDQQRDDFDIDKDEDQQRDDFDIDKNEDQQHDDFDIDKDEDQQRDDFDIDKNEDQQRDDFDIDKDEDQQRDDFDIDKDEDQQRDDFDIDKDEDQQRDAFDIDKDEDQQRDDFDIDKNEDQQRDDFDIDKDEDQQRDDFDIDKDEDQQRDAFDIDKDEDQQRDDFDIDKDEDQQRDDLDLDDVFEDEDQQSDDLDLDDIFEDEDGQSDDLDELQLTSDDENDEMDVVEDGIDVVDVENRLYCIHCEEKLNSQYQFENHMFIHRGLAPYRCEMCTNIFNVKRTLIRHYRDVHKKEPSRDMIQAKGDKVDTTPMEYSSLNADIRNSYFKIKKTLMCAKCPYETTDMQNLRIHLHSGHGLNDTKFVIEKLAFECPRCIRSFMSKSKVMLHLERNHSPMSIMHYKKVTHKPKKQRVL